MSDIRVVVVGCGRAGMIHAGNFARLVPGARLVGLCDPDEVRCRDAAAELGVTAARDASAFSGENADAIVIAAPTRSHRDIAVEAVRSGLHVLCEKPMATHVTECCDMLAEADHAGVVLQLGFMRRFDASFIDLASRLDAGDIGRPVSIRSLTYGPSVPKAWMYDISGSNGPLAEVNSHDIDTLFWLARSEATEVYAIAGNYRCADARTSHPDFYDNVTMTIRFANGVQGIVQGAQGVRYGYDSRCEVLGEFGLLTAGALPIGSSRAYTEQGFSGAPYDSWLDTRCAPYIKIMRKEAGRRIIRKTGGPPSFNHGPKILWWQQERPETYTRIVSFVQPGAYTAMRLCGLSGNEAFIDSSYLHFSGFADNVNERWDRGLCKTFGVAESLLPRIVSPHEIVGEVTAAMARRCGLRAGTPVVAGCGDTAASFLACGATREGVCVDVAGTASVFAATTKTYTPDTKHQVLGWGRSATPGLWHPYAYINGGGMNLEWFRENLAAQGRQAPSLQQLNMAAAKIEPSADDPVFVPHLGGRVSPSWPDLRGAWANITWSHSAAHLYRAVLEGVALEYAVYRDVLTELATDMKLREVRVTGGGEKSALWNQTTHGAS